jgi:hypothetical protein
MNIKKEMNWRNYNMKTIKAEIYNGYSVTIRGEFREKTQEYVSPKEIHDTVDISLSVVGKGVSHFEMKMIQESRNKREEMYSSVIKTVEDLFEKAKEIINKKVREKEMTDGLPESLLSSVGGYTGTWGASGVSAALHNNELILNKEDTEKLLTAVKSATLLGRYVSEVMDSYIEFAKKGDKEEELSRIIRKICEDVIEAKEKQNTETIVNAIKNLPLVLRKSK